MRKVIFTAFFIMSIFLMSFGFCIAQSAKSGSSGNSGYVDLRIKKFPYAMQCWTFHKFTFFETLPKVRDLDIHYIQAFPGQALCKDMPGAVFDHKMTKDQMEIVKQKLQENDITIVAYGVVGMENNEKEIRGIFDFAKKMGIKTVVTEPAFDDYSLLDKLAAEYNLNVAIHNHPEPSKYAHPEVTLAHIKGCSNRIGSCADTGHWMRTGVNPIQALKMLKGRIKDVHLKDLNEFGKKDAYDVPFGQGKANILGILDELSRQDYTGYLTIEHENEKELDNPSPSIKKGLDYIKSITYYEDYTQILKCDDGVYSKHGWNHYGPGYFELDEKNGVLKGQGGMGLFWFSEKKYKDFILELDYKCTDKNTNSGIFLRVPELPYDNAYVNHSFEIQICDAAEGIHKTAGVYDAVAPKADVSKKPGEWNHLKITFKGSHITVEHNGTVTIDWDAVPSGKIQDFADEGYIGLQNHDSISSVYFKNIYVKELN